MESVKAAAAACDAPFGRKGGSDLNALREKLYDVMWQKVGIIREARALSEAAEELRSLETALDGFGMVDDHRAFNLTWHDWMNLKSLVAVSRAIAAAALARRDSRGAHYRSDFPEAGPLEQSSFTSLDAALEVRMKPVRFTRVRPGQSLLRHVA